MGRLEVGRPAAPRLVGVGRFFGGVVRLLGAGAAGVVDLAAGFGQVDDRKWNTVVAVGRGTGPVNQRVLSVRIYDENTLTPFMKSRAKMHGDGALAHPALLLSYRDDFGCQFFSLLNRLTDSTL